MKQTQTLKIEGPLNNEPTYGDLIEFCNKAEALGAPKSAKVSLTRYVGSSSYDDRGSWSITISWTETE